MPPKGDTQKSEEDEVLQAVILADSFNTRFKPLTLHTPRCLLPLCNVPLLQWTFESLALSGVEEIIVVCCAHAELIKEAIATSRFSHSASGVKITHIVSPRSMSVGDAMRELDGKGLISSDFILVTGDVISNLRLDRIMQAHKERRQKNKDAIMTIVAKHTGAIHRTRPVADASVFVLDPETSECVHYETLVAEPSKRRVSIPREVLEKHAEVEIRNDLIDCNIDVCSVDVLLLFSENFDYQDLRKDFVHGVLTSDLLGKQIFCHVVEEGYAARVRDTKTYAAVSKDIISRWSFPLVPGDNLPGHDEYEYRRGNRYMAKEGVVLSRTCTIGNDTMIGPSTRVQDNARIEGSVIGSRCSIGAGTVIRNSYVWDGCYIEANCVIEGSIVGPSVHLFPGCTIRHGCLIADGTKLGPSAIIPEFKRISREKPPPDEEDDDEEVEEAPAATSEVVLGDSAEAYLWPDTVGADPGDDGVSSSRGKDVDLEDEDMEMWSNFRHLRIGSAEPDPDLSESESESASTDVSPSLSPTSTASLLTPVESIPSFSLGPTSAANFRSECVASLERALAEGHTGENAAIELKTLRMASNVSMTEVREVVIDFIVGLVHGEPGSPQQKKEVGAVIKHWAGLVSELVATDKLDIIRILQKTCATKPNYTGVFGLFLINLYNEDVVDEVSIGIWYRDPQCRKASGKASQASMEACWKQGTAVVNWLNTADDDDDDDDEDEED